MDEIDIKKYPLKEKIRIDDGKSLVLYSSYPTFEVEYKEISGKEIFLLDNNKNIIWQISPELGRTDGKTWKFDKNLPSYSYFLEITIEDGFYMATRFNGDVFKIDMETGNATFAYWKKT